VLLKHFLGQGEPVARLAKRLRIGRRTIYRLIATGQLERDLDAGQVADTPRPPVVQKLDAYKAAGGDLPPRALDEAGGIARG
jgi:hypothetical protein